VFTTPTRIEAAARRWLAPALLSALLVACTPEPANSQPDGAVREFIESMRAFNGRESDAKRLYAMLSKRAKSNLQARAQRYGAASGKTISPSAMLVPARVTPTFEPQRYSANIVGRYAMVEVLGVAAGERAKIPCVFEDGAWRVDLVLPELPPLRRRGEGDDVTP
jgi:hypothetical protein